MTASTANVRQLFHLNVFPFFLYQEEGAGYWGVCSHYCGFEHGTYLPGIIGGSRSAGQTCHLQPGVPEASAVSAAEVTEVPDPSVILEAIKPLKKWAEKGDYFVFWPKGSDPSDPSQAICICIDKIGRCTDTILPYFEAFGRVVPGGLQELLARTDLYRTASLIPPSDSQDQSDLTVVTTT